MKNPSNDLFFSRLYNPFWQGGITFFFIVFGMLSIKGLQVTGNMDWTPHSFWVVCGTGMLVYALFSSILSLSITGDMNQYWTRSTAAYASIMGLGGCLAWYFSGMMLSEAASFKWIFMVVTFGYLLFLSLMRFIRKVAIIAQQEDNRWMQRRK
ncbi:MAG: hypothetical protein U5L45_23775 [Saprospiraceae bacterium]|nr:hypothetical protein [Saprospiraceae bacterium]